MGLQRLEAAGRCRHCKQPAWMADNDGPIHPVHPCCDLWKDTIAAGNQCPACAASRAYWRGKR